MCPNVCDNVFREIAAIKAVKLADNNNNVVEWLTSMEMKRISIELKIPGAYDEMQFLMDVYQGALEAKCKTFTTEVQSMKQKWLLGTLPNSSRIETVYAITQLYSNLVEDGTWKREFSETDQIVALTTLVSQMETKFSNQTVALATQDQPSTDPGGNGKKKRGKGKGPYCVEVWRLEKKSESLMKDGNEWHWCTKDHYHDNAVKNGMYAPHKTSEHDAWRKEHDENKGSKYNSFKKDDATPSTAPSADAKKLSLSRLS